MWPIIPPCGFEADEGPVDEEEAGRLWLHPLPPPPPPPPPLFDAVGALAKTFTGVASFFGGGETETFAGEIVRFTTVVVC